MSQNREDPLKGKEQSAAFEKKVDEVMKQGYNHRQATAIVVDGKSKDDKKK